jgi:hypothetical protein
MSIACHYSRHFGRKCNVLTLSENYAISRIPSSLMWRRVSLVRTYVSEEPVASIFSIERISELGTTLQLTRRSS